MSWGGRGNDREDLVETAAQVLHNERNHPGLDPACGVCRRDAQVVADVVLDDDPEESS
jgi:hypothetical protein